MRFGYKCLVAFFAVLMQSACSDDGSSNPVDDLLAISALVVDMSVVVDWRRVGCAAILWVAFNVWFFGFTFGTMSFAPWERLRSGSRRVKMSDKKKKSAKKK